MNSPFFTMEPLALLLGINQSINQNLYSTPSRYLLRGAPDPGQAEKNGLAVSSTSRRSLCLSAFLFICTSVYLLVLLSVSLSVCLSLRGSVCRPVFRQSRVLLKRRSVDDCNRTALSDCPSQN